MAGTQHSKGRVARGEAAGAGRSRDMEGLVSWGEREKERERECMCMRAGEGQRERENPKQAPHSVQSPMQALIS